MAASRRSAAITFIASWARRKALLPMFLPGVPKPNNGLAADSSGTQISCRQELLEYMGTTRYFGEADERLLRDHIPRAVERKRGKRPGAFSPRMARLPESFNSGRCKIRCLVQIGFRTRFEGVSMFFRC